MYNEHVRDRLEPEVLLLKRLIEATSPSLCDEWLRIVSKYIWDKEFWGLDKPFAALTYDVFDHYFPREQREHLGLKLVRPGRLAPTTSHLSAPPNFSPAQAQWCDETKWAIRAIGPQNSSEHEEFLKAALRAILFDPAYQPMNEQELAGHLSHPIVQALTKVRGALWSLSMDGMAIIVDQEYRWASLAE